jgi:hypothetical protein
MACSRSAPETSQEEKAAAPESHVKRGTNGQVVSLEASTQQVAGLRVTVLKPFEVPPTVKVVGHALDPATLITGVADLISAESASAASAAELSRLEALVAQNNASERALESARAAAARDKALVESARLRLLGSWGKAIAQRKDLQAFVASLSALESVLVELNLPAGEPFEVTPVAAELLSVSGKGQPVRAEFVSPAPVVDRQFQGRGFLFLIAQNNGRLAPGAMVTGFMEMPGEIQRGLEVPHGAVVRHAGGDWVYVQRSETGFERVLVQLARPVQGGWFVPDTSGSLKPGEKVVVAGAQLLLSEEFKTQESE